LFAPARSWWRREGGGNSGTAPDLRIEQRIAPERQSLREVMRLAYGLGAGRNSPAAWRDRARHMAGQGGETRRQRPSASREVDALRSPAALCRTGLAHPLGLPLRADRPASSPRARPLPADEAGGRHAKRPHGTPERTPDPLIINQLPYPQSYKVLHPRHCPSKHLHRLIKPFEVSQRTLGRRSHPLAGNLAVRQDHVCGVRREHPRRAPADEDSSACRTLAVSAIWERQQGAPAFGRVMFCSSAQMSVIGTIPCPISPLESHPRPDTLNTITLPATGRAFRNGTGLLQ
jgi:hypothetical protein